MKMKQDYSTLGIKLLCGLFGKTRPAYYDHLWRSQDQGLRDEIVLQHVLEIRESLPRVGTIKLHHMLKPALLAHQIDIGRDYLFDLMRDHNLDIRRRKRKAITTDSRHWMHKYMNLVKDLIIDRPEQVWVSDITYIRVSHQWAYLSLITDAYSRKIMGYAFRTDLSATGCTDALLMALRSRCYSRHLIHHSDRGSQYCSAAYTKILLEHDIAISMPENGDPYENAIAERANGIIKSEFNLEVMQTTFADALEKITKGIAAYNQLRPHISCDFLTPDEAHQKNGVLRKRWRTKAYNYDNLNCV
jgi:putative transposase